MVIETVAVARFLLPILVAAIIVAAILATSHTADFIKDKVVPTVKKCY